MCEEEEHLPRHPPPPARPSSFSSPLLRASFSMSERWWSRGPRAPLRGDDGPGRRRDDIRDVDSETISLQTPVSRCVRESSRDPRTDLALERARATFRSKELETLLAGGIENVKLRKLVAETVTKDAVFGNKTSEKYSLRREELYRTTLEKYLEIPRVAREILAKMDTIDGGTNNRSESSGSSNNNNRLIAIGYAWARVYRRTGRVRFTSRDVYTDNSRARDRRAEEVLVAQVHEFRNCRDVRANRVGPWDVYQRIGNDVYVRRSKEGIHRTFADVDGDKMVARRIGENSDARDCHGKIVRAVFIVVFYFFCRTSICG